MNFFSKPQKNQQNFAPDPSLNCHSRWIVKIWSSCVKQWPQKLKLKTWKRLIFLLFLQYSPINLWSFGRRKVLNRKEKHGKLLKKTQRWADILKKAETWKFSSIQQKCQIRLTFFRMKKKLLFSHNKQAFKLYFEFLLLFYVK